MFSLPNYLSNILEVTGFWLHFVYLGMAIFWSNNLKSKLIMEEQNQVGT